MRASVSGSGVGLKGRVWMQRVGAFAVLPQLITELGGNPATVLAAVGLDEDALADPEARIPYVAFVRMLGYAAEHSACPHLGLLAGRIFSPAALGVVGQLARHCPTVGRALEALTVYQHINSEGGLAFLLKRGDFVDLGYAVYQPGTRGAAQMYDATIAAGMNLMTALCGPAWKPYEVLLSRVRPDDVAQYRVFFKVVPRFNSEYSALRFRASDLERVVNDADPSEYRRAEERVLSAGSPDFLQQVYRGVRRLMLENLHSADDLAKMLAMHRRTLNRRLRMNGTTFQKVLDDVRFEVGRDLLANTDVFLDDIAATLGYSAVTPFMRAFRRWSGTTPGQWRQQSRAGANDSQHDRPLPRSA